MKEEASIEIELFNPSPANVVIRRRFDQSGGSSWTVDGKPCGVREVERRVGQFRIQVDNLCQFYDCAAYGSVVLSDQAVQT